MRRRLAMLALAIALWAAPAFAQGCAMCWTSATGASKSSQRALSRGVVVLLIPPVGLMIGIVGFSFHYGREKKET